MKESAVLIIGAVVAGLMMLCGGFYIESLQTELKAAQEDVTTAQQATVDRDETIRLMLEKQRLNDQARKKLDASRASIRLALADRETTIRNLQNENIEMRAWAALALPDAVVRMQQHGPFTGATAYRERVSKSAAVQPASR